MAEALTGKVAVITGAGRGIGAATARLFASEGARVVLVSRSADELNGVAQNIEGIYGPDRVLVVAADISDEAAVISLFEQTAAKFGPTDILINNAGLFEGGQLAEMEAATWDRVMAVNVRGPFLCSREAFKQMIASGKGGNIVNLSSLSGVRGPEKFPGMGSYVVSKYGILGLTEILAVEGRPHRIRVNAVSPGAVETAMLKKAAPFLNTSTMPEDVARTILFLADDATSRHLTGANIEIFSNE